MTKDTPELNEIEMSAGGLRAKVRNYKTVRLVCATLIIALILLLVITMKWTKFIEALLAYSAAST